MCCKTVTNTTTMKKALDSKIVNHTNGEIDLALENKNEQLLDLSTHIIQESKAVSEEECNLMTPDEPHPIKKKYLESWILAHRKKDQQIACTL